MTAEAGEVPFDHRRPRLPFGCTSPARLSARAFASERSSRACRSGVVNRWCARRTSSPSSRSSRSTVCPSACRSPGASKGHVRNRHRDPDPHQHRAAKKEAFFPWDHEHPGQAQKEKNRRVAIRHVRPRALAPIQVKPVRDPQEEARLLSLVTTSPVRAFTCRLRLSNVTSISSSSRRYTSRGSCVM